MNNRIGWIIIGIVLIVIIYFFFVKKSDNDQVTNENDFKVKETDNYDIITLKLPNDSDPKVFGPHYWKAFHKLAAMIPCGTCQEKAVMLMRFMHDIVNKETEKGLYDKENYDFWVNYLSSPKQ